MIFGATETLCLELSLEYLWAHLVDSTWPLLTTHAGKEAFSVQAPA